MAVFELTVSNLLYSVIFLGVTGIVSKWLYDRQQAQQVR